MSRWDAESDLDYYDEPWNRRFNATCSDCDAPFTKLPADVGTLCDTCCSLRDTHTSAVEIRMAKATLKAGCDFKPVTSTHIPGVIDVALVPVSETSGVVTVALVPVVKQLPEIETIPLADESLNGVKVKELVTNVDLIVEETNA